MSLTARSRTGSRTARRRVGFRPTEATLRGLLEAAPDAMVIVGGTGRIVFVNAQTEKLFGYPRDALLGEPVEMLVPERFRERYGAHRGRYSADPKVLPMGMGLELFGRRRDGSEFPVEISLSPLESEGGILILSAIRDISDRKQAEAEMLRLATILDHSDDAIVGWDLQGVVVAWNRGASRMYGYSVKEMKGRSVSVLFPAEDSAELQWIMNNIRRRGRIEHYETTRVRKNGDRVDVSVAVSPILDPAGQVIGSSTIERDITERKKTQQQVLASLREKEVLLTEVHHRVKNNLQVVSSLLALQAETVGEPQARAFKESQDRVRSMALVHEQLYRSENVSRIDFSSYLRELASGLLASYGTDGDRVRLRIDAGDVQLSLESAIHAGLLVNELLSNCLKHAFPGGRAGTVEVQLRRSGNDLDLVVRDDGVGFPAGADGRDGKTLGLKLVETLVQQLGGGLEFATGAGTTFRIRFPQPPPPEAC